MEKMTINNNSTRYMKLALSKLALSKLAEL